MADKSALCGHGKRKMNLSHSRTPEEALLEEQETEVIQEAAILFSILP
jgi:hypothetical protein